ncbi:hypothetical protein RHA1_ro10155 (plasmid) [Rhodococcus jostii RHA1]|uniref:Uncharacterized protein n=1 Tax=Rhodococcus jostii (strain RHA1) TaxID=101510 RepID=Q0RWI8_RHOJR|nr:hypothetical protein RHA1_ro10155 [Rhodococcus jostii RHA1]
MPVTAVIIAPVLPTRSWLLPARVRVGSDIAITVHQVVMTTDSPSRLASTGAERLAANAQSAAPQASCCGAGMPAWVLSSVGSRSASI